MPRHARPGRSPAVVPHSGQIVMEPSAMPSAYPHRKHWPWRSRFCHRRRSHSRTGNRASCRTTNQIAAQNTVLIASPAHIGVSGMACSSSVFQCNWDRSNELDPHGYTQFDASTPPRMRSPGVSRRSSPATHRTRRHRIGQPASRSSKLGRALTNRAMTAGSVGGSRWARLNAGVLISSHVRSSESLPSVTLRRRASRGSSNHSGRQPQPHRRVSVASVHWATRHWLAWPTSNLGL